MSRLLRRRPTPAFAVAVLALAVALGGTSFASDAAALNVVTEDTEHYSAGRATSVRYGCPSRSPRRNIMRSAVA